MCFSNRYQRVAHRINNSFTFYGFGMDSKSDSV